MHYVCDAPGGKTWFRIETEAEALRESEMMRHAVEKYDRREREKAAQSFRPRSNVFFEQEIGFREHIHREMPLFLTLRDDDGDALATAMLPPSGREDRSFRTIIVAGKTMIPICNARTRSRHWPGITASRWNGPVATRIAAIEAAELRRDLDGYDLRAFASAAHDILAGAPGPEGRQRVCDLMRDALRDPGFVASVLGDATPERQILYEDPELGFCILAHNYKGAKQSPPHDHGPSWAIYGQASGETLMSDWALVEPATEDRPGRVRHVRDYALTPGMATSQRGRPALSPSRRPNTTNPHRRDEHGRGAAGNYQPV